MTTSIVSPSLAFNGSGARWLFTIALVRGIESGQAAIGLGRHHHIAQACELERAELLLVGPNAVTLQHDSVDERLAMTLIENVGAEDISPRL
jgi:hypothetical protein